MVSGEKKVEFTPHRQPHMKSGVKQFQVLILALHKDSWNNNICSNRWMAVEILTKWSRSHKDKYHRCHKYIEIQYDRKELIQNRHMEKKKPNSWLTKGKAEWRINNEFGINIYMVLYINRQLTRTCYIAQGTILRYFVITYKGKESKIKIPLYLYISISESLCCTPEPNEKWKC